MLILAAGEATAENTALIQNDAVIAGILLAMLAFVFWSSSHANRYFKAFYKIVPMLLMCYFLPSLLTAFGVVDPLHSNLYRVASRYLLPASLVLLTISIDFGEVLKLGPKALIMFLTGTVGVVLGGPLAVLLVSFVNAPLVGDGEAPVLTAEQATEMQAESDAKFLQDNPGKQVSENPEKFEEGSKAVWRGLSTVAGSWIGGGANLTAMKELFEPNGSLFSVMATVDVIVAEIWMVFLLLGVGRADAIDRFFKADSSSIESLKNKMEEFSNKNARIPTTTDLMVLLGISFGATAISHAIADVAAPYIGEHYPKLKEFSLHKEFFWIIMVSTSIGLTLSFTRARNVESIGASKVGTVFIFILVATIGLQMDLMAIKDHPGLFLVGGIWMLFHVLLLFIVGYLIRAPYFFLAVGSKANIGGAASAPVVAAAFHPSLAPVGVLLAVVGYALGTYGAYLCGVMMKMVAPG